MGTRPMPSVLPKVINSAWAHAQCLQFWHCTLKKLGKKGQFVCNLVKKTQGGGHVYSFKRGGGALGGPCLFFREGRAIGMGGPLAWRGGGGRRKRTAVRIRRGTPSICGSTRKRQQTRQASLRAGTAYVLLLLQMAVGCSSPGGRQPLTMAQGIRPPCNKATMCTADRIPGDQSLGSKNTSWCQSEEPM